MVQPGYRHTQRGPLYLVLIMVAAVFGACAWGLPGGSLASALFLSVAVVFCVLAAAFRELTVEDQGDALLVRFGPLPAFWKRFSYCQMCSVAVARSTLIDGLGIHYIPGRGWIYNLWGTGCVAIDMGKRTVRIGSDDVEGLVAFLQGRIQRQAGP